MWILVWFEELVLHDSYNRAGMSVSWKPCWLFTLFIYITDSEEYINITPDYVSKNQS